MSGVPEGRTAPVTGVGSGIGRASAAALARAGAVVAVCRHADRAGAEGARRLDEEAGRRAIVCRADVRDEAQVERLAEEVARRILHLATDEADYVTGRAFVVDGGPEMRWGQGA
jgi:NAD(P)-dependent dehydrogenase (short-subunit alcohol dehydrogenase family)